MTYYLWIDPNTGRSIGSGVSVWQGRRPADAIPAGAVECTQAQTSEPLSWKLVDGVLEPCSDPPPPPQT